MSRALFKLIQSFIYEFPPATARYQRTQVFVIRLFHSSITHKHLDEESRSKNQLYQRLEEFLTRYKCGNRLQIFHRVRLFSYIQNAAKKKTIEFFFFFVGCHLDDGRCIFHVNNIYWHRVRTSNTPKFFAPFYITKKMQGHFYLFDNLCFN